MFNCSDHGERQPARPFHVYPFAILGGVGTGKTHLSIALGMACCQRDYRVRFVTAAELVTLLVEA